MKSNEEVMDPPVVPRLHGVTSELAWATGVLVPAIREARADRCGRRSKFVAPTAVVGSDLWFAQSAYASFNVYRADNAAYGRTSDTTNALLDRASYLASLLHLQFTAGVWWQNFVPWAEQTQSPSASLRDYLWSSRHAAYGWQSGQRCQYIANDTVNKVNIQLQSLAEVAVQLGVSGPLRLQCELMVSGVLRVDAAEVVELAVPCG